MSVVRTNYLICLLLGCAVGLSLGIVIEKESQGKMQATQDSRTTHSVENSQQEAPLLGVYLLSRYGLISTLCILVIGGLAISNQLEKTYLTKAKKNTITHA